MTSKLVDIFLIELDLPTGYENYGFYATGEGYVDVPNGRTYLPIVIDAGSIAQFMFGNGSTKGTETSASLGRIALNNTNRWLNVLRQIPVHGRALRVFQLVNNVKTLKYYGIVNSLDINNEQVVITLKNPIDIIKNNPILPLTYAGTNDGSTIFAEGDSNLKGNPKPLVLGECTSANMTPVLVNRSLLLYQVSFMPINDFGSVRIGGTGQTRRTQHTSLASLVTAASGGAGGPIPAGSYDYYLGGGATGLDINNNETGAYFALGTIPDKPVTFTASEGYTSQVIYPRDFFNAAWTKLNANGYYDTFSGNTTNGVHSIKQNIAMTSGNTQFLTAYVKQLGAADGVEIRLTNPAGTITRTARISFREQVADFPTGGFLWYLNGKLDSSYAGYRAVSFSMDKADLTTTGNGSIEFRLLKYNGSTAVSTYLDSFVGSVSDGAYILGLVVEEAKNDFFTGGSYSDLSFLTWHYFSNPHYQSGSPTRANYLPKLLEKIWAIARKPYIGGNISYQMLDPDSVIHASRILNPGDSYSAGVYITDASTTLGDLLQNISDSGKLAFFDTQRLDALGNVDVYPYIRYFCPAGGVSPYMSAPSVKLVLDSRILLGSPKIRFSANSDNLNGIPTGKFIINHTKNYTPMTEADLYGSVDPSSFSYEWRAETSTDATVVSNYPSIYATSIVNTLLAGSSSAGLRKDLELKSYGVFRQIIEVLVPSSLTESLILGDIVTVQDRQFGPDLGSYIPSYSTNFVDSSAYFDAYTGVLIGISKKFPTSGKGDILNTVTLQIWV